MAGKPGSDRKKLQKILSLAVEGMGIDGGHHKQYYLYKILKVIGVPDQVIRDGFGIDDFGMG
jgi:hypothetical protein